MPPYGILFMKTTTNTTQKKKRATAQKKTLTAQFKKDLSCILGTCNHVPTSRTCAYWKKVVDSDFPEQEQERLILKLVKDELNAKI